MRIANHVRQLASDIRDIEPRVILEHPSPTSAGALAAPYVREFLVLAGKSVIFTPRLWDDSLQKNIRIYCFQDRGSNFEDGFAILDTIP